MAKTKNEILGKSACKQKAISHAKMYFELQTTHKTRKTYQRKRTAQTKLNIRKQKIK